MGEANIELITRPGKYSRGPVNVYALTSNVVQKVYDKNNEPPLGKIVIQNCGTNPVKVKCNDDPKTNDFELILAGCAAQDDGLGSVVSYIENEQMIDIRVVSLGAGGRIAVSTWYKYASS